MGQWPSFLFHQLYNYYQVSSIAVVYMIYGEAIAAAIRT